MAEDARCGGCDCVPNEDGCECREVACVACGVRDHIYNMEHALKDDCDWAYIPFSDKLDGFYCPSCFGADDCEEEQREDYEDYFE